MKPLKNTIQSVHRQHFADSRVVIQDHRAGILGTIVVAHANVGPADEGRVTEDDPRLLRSGEKTFPENVKSDRHIRTIACKAGLRGSAVQEAVRGDGNGGSEHNGKCNDGNDPGTRGAAVHLRVGLRLVRSSRVVASSPVTTWMKGESAGPFGQLHE